MADARPIRVLLMKEDGFWVAQCLEYDIGAQARDLDQLHDRLASAIDIGCREGLRRHGAEFAGIEPAPPYFHELWDRRAGSFQPRPDHAKERFGLKFEFGLAA